MKSIKIISGGQTGADRAALDWALARGVECGGWCPKGRKAEDGKRFSNGGELLLERQTVSGPEVRLPGTTELEALCRSVSPLPTGVENGGFRPLRLPPQP